MSGESVASESDFAVRKTCQGSTKSLEIGRRQGWRWQGCDIWNGISDDRCVSECSFLRWKHCRNMLSTLCSYDVQGIVIRECAEVLAGYGRLGSRIMLMSSEWLLTSSWQKYCGGVYGSWSVHEVNRRIGNGRISWNGNAWNSHCGGCAWNEYGSRVAIFKISPDRSLSVSCSWTASGGGTADVGAGWRHWSKVNIWEAWGWEINGEGREPSLEPRELQKRVISIK